MRMPVPSRLLAGVACVAALGALLILTPLTGAQSTSAPASQPAGLSLPAIVVPDEQVDLYAKASGYVSRITVDYGARVKRGDVLIELEIPELRDELRQAEAALLAREAKVQSLQAKVRQAELLVESARAQQQHDAAERELAKITFGRKSELYQAKAIPAQEYDVAKIAVTLADAQVRIGEAKVAAAEGDLLSAKADVQAGQADLKVSQADLARAKSLMEYTTLRAPFDAVVTQRRVDHGAFVRSAAQGAGEPLLTLMKVDRVRVAFDVPEQYAAAIRPGSPALLQIRARGDSAAPVTVTRTAGAIQTTTRTMRAEIDLDNPDGRLIPGAYARVTLPLDAKP